MAIPRNIKQYLFHNSVSYSHRTHATTYTSQQTAQADHVKPEQFAKTVILIADSRKIIMVVVPADHVICLDKLKKHLGCETLQLAAEREFAGKFTGCQPGAMPPFGRLFGFPVYCDHKLAEKSEIEFNAGTHADIVRMDFVSFNKLEAPELLDFSEKGSGRLAARSA